MGRQVRRVPPDFNHPLNKVWDGFLMPDRFDEADCPGCTSGYSPHAQHLYDLWYGKIPFDPASTGSTPFPPTHPAIQGLARRNVDRAPEFYGTSSYAFDREARRLADHFNNGWLHHLDQDDVDALLEAGRLMDFTHRWSAETRKLEPIEPAVTPTAIEVNEWSLRGMGHDGINCGVVIKARCEREGVNDTCATCGGYGSLEAYPGQRAEAEAWEPTEPPTGDGWQLWETVSEGSPISPVFGSAEELAHWMSSPDYVWGATKTDNDRPTYDTALRFITAGWAPSFASGPGTGGLVSGVEFVGQQET